MGNVATGKYLPKILEQTVLTAPGAKRANRTLNLYYISKLQSTDATQINSRNSNHPTLIMIISTIVEESFTESSLFHLQK